MIAADISRGEVYLARCERRAVGTFTLQRSDELFLPGATGASGYIQGSRCGARRVAWASSCSRWQNELQRRAGASRFVSIVLRGTMRFALITCARGSCAAVR